MHLSCGRTCHAVSLLSPRQRPPTYLLKRCFFYWWCRLWTWLNALAIGGSLVTFFGFLLVYAAFPMLDGHSQFYHVACEGGLVCVLCGTGSVSGRSDGRCCCCCNRRVHEISSFRRFDIVRRWQLSDMGPDVAIVRVCLVGCRCQPHL